MNDDDDDDLMTMVSVVKQHKHMTFHFICAVSSEIVSQILRISREYS